jgi:hypothetical protein
VKQIWCFLALLLVLAARSGAQEFNAVPLDHPAYEIIAMGVMRGVIIAPPAAKPWSVYTIKEKLSEMLYVSPDRLSSKEEEAVFQALDSFERKDGFVPVDGRYRTSGGNFTFEVGLGWESGFSVGAKAGSIASINMAKIYAGGDIGGIFSWNVAALGGFLYIDREEGRAPPSLSQAAFPYSFSKVWDGGVLSLKNPGVYAAWPDDPALAGAFEAELNGSFLDRRLLLRLGRTRHDWGYRSNGESLFLNAHARPFTSIEASFLPLLWLNISFLGGALERFKENAWYPGETSPSESASHNPFTNMLLAGQVEVNLKYFGLGMGGTAVVSRQTNAAFFADFELYLPGLFTLWGSVFLDHLNKSLENFSTMNGNNYAYQAGIKTTIYWLPLSSFTLRYTKIEPYCYAGEQISTSFMSGGESLGYYMPPNSDELLLRFESMPFPDIKFHVQFQMMRHGADFGTGRVPGSSPYDTVNDRRTEKFFLKDGVYQWNNTIKLGASCNLRSSGVPILIYTETGLVFTNYTINGKAGIGSEGDYETLEDSEYRPGTKFIFSMGFRLFP